MRIKKSELKKLTRNLMVEMYEEMQESEGEDVLSILSQFEPDDEMGQNNPMGGPMSESDEDDVLSILSQFEPDDLDGQSSEVSLEEFKNIVRQIILEEKRILSEQLFGDRETKNVKKAAKRYDKRNAFEALGRYFAEKHKDELDDVLANGQIRLLGVELAKASSLKNMNPADANRLIYWFEQTDLGKKIKSYKKVFNKYKKHKSGFSTPVEAVMFHTLERYAKVSNLDKVYLKNTQDDTAKKIEDLIERFLLASKEGNEFSMKQHAKDVFDKFSEKILPDLDVKWDPGRDVEDVTKSNMQLDRLGDRLKGMGVEPSRADILVKILKMGKKQSSLTF